jgi:hypothetical protein
MKIAFNEPEKITITLGSSGLWRDFQAAFQR